VVQSTQGIDGVNYGFTNITYDKAGNLRSLTYPSGRLVSTGYDLANRISQLFGQKAGGTLGGIGVTHQRFLSRENTCPFASGSLFFYPALWPTETRLGATDSVGHFEQRWAEIR
jgi:hypothetical protein